MNKHVYALTLLIFSTQFILAQRIVINFDATPNTPPSVSKATLRYDKDFAYSLTFDDATDDGYTCALPALQGGLSACSGTTVTPLYYTDGCGNNLLFKAGIAWNSANFYGQDSHTGNTPGLLTWTQLDELLARDWDVLNHSFSHKSRWLQYMPGTEYINEIVKNRSEVKQKTAKNYDTPIFVVPSGDTYYEDIAYTQGQELVFNQSANTIARGGLAINTDFSPNNNVLHRQLVEDALNSGRDIIGGVASRSATGEHIWYNEFTHKLDGSTGLSFSNFRNHVERIANTWGKNGTDRIWVAGLQEVYEYLTVRKNIKYTATVSGNQLIIDFDLQSLPTWLRRKPLTLVVNSNTSFSSVNATQGVKITYKGTGSKKIINLDFAGASNINPCDSDTIPPVLTLCPQNISLMTTGTSATATWLAPTVTDNCTTPPSVKSNFSSGQSFPIGTTNVIYTATDAKNNSKTCSFNIIVSQTIVNPCDNDVTPPVLSNCPQNISLTTSGTSATATWLAPTATDNCTTPPSVKSNFSSGQSFPIGTTNVIYTATDAKNNSKTCSFNIIVSQTIVNPCDNDVTPPILSNCPQNISLTTSGTSATATWLAPTATDNCTTPPSVKSNFSSGQSFPIGTTNVIYTATDAKNNSKTCSFNIIVSQTIVNPCDNDVTPPVLSNCPQNISLTTSGTSATATWLAPTATDNCTTPPSVKSNFSSGQSFPIGTTNVIYMATDAKNNSKTCSFNVVVQSNTQNSLDLSVHLSTTPTLITRPYTYATYRITLKNQSAQNCSNILVTFPFPQGLVNGGLPQATAGIWREYCPNSRICYEWTIDNLAANATATLDVPLFVLGLSSPITATAKLVSSIPSDNNANDNQSSVTIGGNTVPTLSTNAKPSQTIPIVVHKIMPNPSEGDIILIIESLNEREATFNVSDAFGKIIKTETHKVVKGSNQLLFDMWSLPQGLYFITPTTSLGRGMPIKFVKI